MHAYYTSITIHNTIQACESVCLVQAHQTRPNLGGLQRASQDSTGGGGDWGLH